MKSREGAVPWEVGFSASAARQKKRLPRTVLESLARLIADLEAKGPIQKGWPHFSALKRGKGIPENAYHCHIKNGRPTYVACWEVEDKKIKLIRVFYAGTHENAPY